MRQIRYAGNKKAGDVLMLHRQTVYQANDFYLNTDFSSIKNSIINKLTRPKYEVLQNSDNILAIKKGQCVIRVNSIGNVEVFSKDLKQPCNEHVEIKVIQEAFKTKIPDFEIISKETEEMVSRIKGMPIKVVAVPSSFAGIKCNAEGHGVSALSAAGITEKAFHKISGRKITKSRREPLKNKNTFNACADTNHMK